MASKWCLFHVSTHDQILVQKCRTCLTYAFRKILQYIKLSVVGYSDTYPVPYKEETRLCAVCSIHRNCQTPTLQTLSLSIHLFYTRRIGCAWKYVYSVVFTCTLSKHAYSATHVAISCLRTAQSKKQYYIAAGEAWK